jgi:hypothetical protein
MEQQGAQQQYNAYDGRNNGLTRRATDEASSSSNSLAPYNRPDYPRRSSTDPGDQNQPAPKPKRSGKICGKCGEGLTGQFVRALGDTYHLECFTCHVRLQLLHVDWGADAAAGVALDLCATAGCRFLWGLSALMLGRVLLLFTTRTDCCVGLQQNRRFEIFPRTREAARAIPPVRNRLLPTARLALLRVRTGPARLLYYSARPEIPH